MSSHPRLFGLIINNVIVYSILFHLELSSLMKLER